jgi:branched-chain amino acid transport system substrate-binding protein
MAQAVDMAAEDANAKHDAGVVFEVIRHDDRGEEREGARIASTLIGDADVMGLVGHYNSNVTLAVAEAYADASMPVISPIVSNPRLTDAGWQNVFRFTNRDDATAAAIVDHLISRMGKRRAVVVRTDTVYGNSMSTQFVQAFERGGGTVLRDYAVDEGATDFSCIVASFPQDMDLVFYGGTFEGAPLLKTMRVAGLRHLLATGDGCWDGWNFLERAGDAAEQGEGVLVLSACPELGVVSGSRAFAGRYAARFGPVQNYALNCYDAAAMMFEAIRLAATENKLSRHSVISALRRIHHRGIAYPAVVSWDGKQDNVAAVTALHVVQEGRFKQIELVGRHPTTAGP